MKQCRHCGMWVADDEVLPCLGGKVHFRGEV